MRGSILIVVDDKELAGRWAEAFGDAGAEVHLASTPVQAAELYRASTPDVVLLELELGALRAPSKSVVTPPSSSEDGEAFDVLRRIREIDGSAQIILTAAQRGGEQLGRALARALGKGGASDFVPRDADPAELEMVLRRALENRRLRREVEHYREATRKFTVPTGHQLIGTSAGILKVRALIEELARTEAQPSPPILIQGETGTGKGLVAHLIHERSRRSRQAFIDVNCTALPDTLVEAELFGFEAGAFTDAKSAKPGLFEAADGGTLFLDEIGDIPLSTQAKLLKVLEEQEVRRVGGIKARKVDIQVIAATNRDLREAVDEKTFRSDLYYRLNVFKVKLPPLRERGDDVLLLAEFLVQAQAAKYRKRDLRMSDAFRRALQGNAWPGNVRELSNVIERSVIVARSGDAIELPGFETERGGINLKFNTNGSLKDFDIPTGGIDLENVERALLEKALDLCGGNVAQAARRLGITRERMRYRIEKYGLGATPDAES